MMQVRHNVQEWSNEDRDKDEVDRRRGGGAPSAAAGRCPSRVLPSLPPPKTAPSAAGTSRASKGGAARAPAAKEVEVEVVAAGVMVTKPLLLPGPAAARGSASTRSAGRWRKPPRTSRRRRRRIRTTRTRTRRQRLLAQQRQQRQQRHRQRPLPPSPGSHPSSSMRCSTSGGCCPRGPSSCPLPALPVPPPSMARPTTLRLRIRSPSPRRRSRTWPVRRPWPLSPAFRGRGRPSWHRRGPQSLLRCRERRRILPVDLPGRGDRRRHRDHPEPPAMEKME